MKRKVQVLSLVSLTIMLMACSKLNLENYDRLKMGMDQKEVENIIGGPDRCEESVGSRSCLWGNKEGTFVKINFIGGKAVLFEHDGLN